MTKYIFRNESCGVYLLLKLNRMHRMETKNLTKDPIVELIIGLPEYELKEVQGVVDWQRWNRLKRGQGKLAFVEAHAIFKRFGYTMRVFKPERSVI